LIKFPEIKKSIEDFLYEEEGNVNRNKVLVMGSLMILTGIMLASDVFAGHRSHSSHSSHRSHSSHSSGSGGHSSHSSHVSHTSHTSGEGGHSSAPVHNSAPAATPAPVNNSAPAATPITSTNTLGTSEMSIQFQIPQIPPDTPPIN